MALPDIILDRGQVLVLPTGESQQGLVSDDGKIQFGVVAMVYSTSDSLAVNDYVMFETDKGNRLIYGSTVYILLNEENISGTEEPTP